MRECWPPLLFLLRTFLGRRKADLSSNVVAPKSKALDSVFHKLWRCSVEGTDLPGALALSDHALDGFSRQERGRCEKVGIVLLCTVISAAKRSSYFGYFCKLVA